MALLRSSSRSYPQVLPQLRQLIGAREFRRLAAAAADSRRIPALVAEKLGKAESEILNEAARRLRVPFLAALPPLEVEGLANIGKLSYFRTAGIAGVCEGGVLVLLAAPLPELLAGIPGLPDNLPVAITSSEAVTSALDQGEQRYRERCRYGPGLGETLSAIHSLVTDATMMGAIDAVITLKPYTVYYRFFDQELCRLVGPDVSISVLQALIEDSLANRGVFRSAFLPTPLRVAPCPNIPGHYSFTPETHRPPNGSGSYGWVVNQLQGRRSGLAARESPQVQRPAREVLIVEDNEVFATVLVKFLAREELQGHWVRSGEEALAFIGRRRNPPDLVICDLHLSNMGGQNMDGVQVVQSLRRQPQCEDLKVLALTSDESSQAEQLLLKAGAAHVVRKSQDSQLLLRQLREMLG